MWRNWQTPFARTKFCVLKIIFKAFLMFRRCEKRQDKTCKGFGCMYSGDKTCKEAMSSLSSSDAAALVDVRTTREWQSIGVPDLSQNSGTAKDVLFVEWQIFPTMQVNPDFANETHSKLEAMGISKNDPVFCLCRSGVRSQGAASALTAIGYTKAYNILGGFEGDPDASGERTRINGWVFDQLPSKREGSNDGPKAKEQRE